MPREIELALAVYLNYKFYEMKLIANVSAPELDKIHRNLVE